uniref:Uncharacterized protein n=1 Tax=Pristionchus pacificus TaxID=54126 RepID=A0A2A6BAV9_PRIPA|eukprot:PDM62996.1 hypothetical protein PRIPAC_50211 [Pristionchus pacificus]
MAKHARKCEEKTKKREARDKGQGREIEGRSTDLPRDQRTGSARTTAIGIPYSISAVIYVSKEPRDYG